MTALAYAEHGDSNAKKLARYRALLEIRRRVGDDRFRECRFLYLAGPHGGEASALKGFGVPAENQLAVDADAGALEAFCALHPDVPTIHGLSSEVEGRFDVVFLDFFSNIEGPDLSEWLAQGVRSLSHRRDRAPFFGYSVMRGREHRPVFRQVQEAAQRRVKLMLDTCDEIAGEARGLSMFMELQRTRPEWCSRRAIYAHARYEVACGWTAPVVRECRQVPSGGFLFTYFGLSPMMIHGTHFIPANRGWSEDKYEREVVRVIKAQKPADCFKCAHFGQQSVADLLDAVEADGHGDVAHLLLNLPRGTVAAHRAIRTRRRAPSALKEAA